MKAPYAEALGRSEGYTLDAEMVTGVSGGPCIGKGKGPGA